VEKILEYNAYLALLNEKIASQKEYVNSLQEDADKIRENVLKIMQERKMLDKLKEHKYQNYLDENKREEQQLLDEVAGNKYERGMTGD
jgi:flagellar FliJ protein